MRNVLPPFLAISCFLAAFPDVGGQTSEIQEQVQIKLELKRLEGTWVPESINVNGKGEVRDDKIKTESFAFKGQSFQRKKNGKTILEGRLEINPNLTPKTLDMIVTNRKPAGKSLGVYELKGDTLTVCFDVTGKGRPAELRAGVDRSLVVYKRQKP
jgi:uncharacterized protein (TIGR03067 family)